MFLERLTELMNIKCDGKQVVLAERTGIAQGTISCYFTRGSMPSADQLIRLANFFNCSVDYLLGREDDFGFIQSNADEYTSAEKRIVSIYRGLSEREKALFDNLVNSFDDNL